MKKITILFLITSICIIFPLISCGGTNPQKTEESKNEENIVSADLPIADPHILLYDNMYYAYGTSSDKGFDVYLSTDLKAWQKHTEPVLKKENSYGEKWFWAPEVYYNEANKKFYLYYSAEEHICVATSDSPLGPFVQDEKKPMREEKGIDSSLFVDEDGTPYIYFVRFTNGNALWVAELESDWKTIKENTLTEVFAATEAWELKEGKVVEGPSVIKRKDTYYLLYSANDFRSQDYGVGYATANSPMGPWKKAQENPILHKPESQYNLVGVGHGAYLKDMQGNFKYVFHAHHDITKVGPRLLYIVDMSLTDKGFSMDDSTIIKPYVVTK